MTLLDMIGHIHRQHTIASIQHGGARRVAATAMAQAAVDNSHATAHVLTPRMCSDHFCVLIFAPVL